MIGAPVLARSRLHDRGDYQLLTSRRIIPGNAVRYPRRGSAVSAAQILVLVGMEIPPLIAEEAAAELLANERPQLPGWLRR